MDLIARKRETEKFDYDFPIFFLSLIEIRSQRKSDSWLGSIARFLNT
jgi:hypothetical protein